MAASYRQRATILMGLPPLLDELGVPLDRVLDGAGLSAADLSPGTFLPYAQFLALLDRAAELSGCDDLGVRLARRLSLAALGPAGQVMRHAATLGEALNDYVQFQIWNSTGGSAYVYQTPQDVAFGYGIYDPAGYEALQIHDLVLGAGCRLIFLLTDHRVRPLELWLMRPPSADPRPLATFAGCPVYYEREQTCIFLPPEALEFPLKDADSRAHNEALSRLASLTAAGPWGKAAAVRHALRTSITTGRIVMPEISGRLGQHTRSLRRALEKEGTTFAALREEVRYTVARELLSLTPLPMSEIASALGFSGSSTFSHSFRHWSGTTPTNWRRKYTRNCHSAVSV
ncbi:AraC family transcriptional regulator [Hoeflea sp. WL0058]|uniref:AraC family transcriptional regulator n=1 Tax=Flavimaribacter sediminis TaxID=2865987 RepID=A0AAE3D0L2_9HYPH|nr:AraC family transcriptional regulator [Flavimaribacter sediminis]MBW8636876.1 AraC family transcriptional regulator [Flavimaribacter sediminis]